jgi:DNA-binding transcriptional MocR family regulator
MQNMSVRSYTPEGTTSEAIAASVEAAVRSGRLGPGDPLAPVRSVAAERGLSASTVAAAYRELRRRGVVLGAGRAGTRIRGRPPVGVHLQVAPPSGVRNLLGGGPDPALLPELPRVPPPGRSYGDPPVAGRLGSLAAENLAADGIDPRHLAVVSGALDGVERLLGAWLRVGDRVIVEDPGYTAVLDLVAAMGFVTVPVPVDDFGVLPGELEEALRRGSDAAIFTPRAQNPTGAAWDEARAGRVREVLKRSPDLLVIEDDHAGPVAGAPALSVCRGRRRWATVRSVSKSLGPDLRLAVLVGDETTVARVEGRQALGIGWVSHLLQETVAALLADPAIPPLLERANSVYARRRAALRGALERHGLEVTGRSGLVAWVPVGDEDGVTARLAAAGWAVSPGQRFRSVASPGIRIGLATLDPPDSATLSVDLARCVHQRPVRFD